MALLKDGRAVRVMGQLSRFARYRGLLWNIATLYSIQVASYVLPLLTIPYLTRVLGTVGWGLVAFSQSFGQYSNLVVEYGFNLSATREVARHRDSRDVLAQLLAGVTGAKSLLTLVAILIAYAGYRWVPVLQANPNLLWASMVASVAQGFNLLWFFQGLERMRVVAALDIAGRIVSTFLVFLVVNTPMDGWKVLILQGGTSMATTSVAYLLAYREVPFRWPIMRDVVTALRMGWAMFLSRSAVSLYTTGNAFILGLFVPPQLVGFYAGAEKVIKAVLGLLGPVSQALFPRVSKMVHTAREEAAVLAKTAIIVLGSGGFLAGGAVWLLAPHLVEIALGPEFGGAVDVLRILALLPALVAASNVLGIQWLLPLGLDRPYTSIIVGGGFVNLSLAIILAPHFAHTGMASAVVASETFVTVAMYLYLRWRNLDPVTYSKKVKGVVT